MDGELLLITVTLVAMFSAAAAKAVSARLIHRLEEKISAGNQARSKVMGRLKMAEAQKSVMEKNKDTLEKKKVRLVKKIEKVARDLDALEGKATQKKKLAANMRDSLIKPTRAAPGDR